MANYDDFTQADETIENYYKFLKQETPPNKYLSAYIIQGNKRIHIWLINYASSGLVSLGLIPDNVKSVFSDKQFLLVHLSSLRIFFEYRDTHEETPLPPVQFQRAMPYGKN